MHKLFIFCLMTAPTITLAQDWPLRGPDMGTEPTAMPTYLPTQTEEFTTYATETPKPPVITVSIPYYVECAVRCESNNGNLWSPIFIWDTDANTGKLRVYRSVGRGPTRDAARAAARLAFLKEAPAQAQKTYLDYLDIDLAVLDEECNDHFLRRERPSLATRRSRPLRDKVESCTYRKFLR